MESSNGGDSKPLVIKFGGTSVGSGARFVRAATITTEAARRRPVAVVVSAMGGATDTLLGFANATAKAARAAARDAARGVVPRTSTGATREGSVAELHRALKERHLQAAREAISQEYLPAVERELLRLLGELVEVLVAPASNLAARRDSVAVFGERLSAVILAGAIRSLGQDAAVVAEAPIATDSNFGEAEVDAEETRERCSRYVTPILDEGTVAVVPGYAGRTPDGLPATLGRGGSDLSATVLGRALGSREVWILTDVNGVLDADPRLVPEAMTLTRLSYQEAHAFAGLGAKVLHPRTMEPAIESGMEVIVRNTFDPEGPDTLVSNFEDEPGVRCLALRLGLEIEVPCTHGHKSRASAVICIGTPEDADTTNGLRALREAGIPILYHGSIPAGLLFMVPAEIGERALLALHDVLICGPREAVA